MELQWFCASHIYIGQNIFHRDQCQRATLEREEILDEQIECPSHPRPPQTLHRWLTQNSKKWCDLFPIWLTSFLGWHQNCSLPDLVPSLSNNFWLAILIGFKAQMECDGRMSPTLVGLHSLMGGDLKDELPLNMVEAGKLYGELLKLEAYSGERRGLS